jgi:4'-phosphopantetheinyl transferase EntD
VVTSDPRVETLGLDLEPLHPHVEPAVAPCIASWAELEQVSTALAQARVPDAEAASVKVAFVMKEAYFKAVHPLCRTFLEATEIAIRHVTPEGGFACTHTGSAVESDHLAGRWLVARGVILAGCFVRRSSPL